MPYSDDLKEEVIRRRLNREPIERIQMEIGVSTHTITRWCSAAGIKIDQRAAVKARWPLATEDQKADVLRYRAAGLSYEKISPLVKLSVWQIREIVRKATRRELSIATLIAAAPPAPTTHPAIRQSDSGWIGSAAYQAQLMSGGRPIIR